MSKKWVCNISIQEKTQNCWIFFKKSGKNMRKFIVLSIPPGRGDQLMPLFETRNRGFWRSFLGFWGKLWWVNEICYAYYTKNLIKIFSQFRLNVFRCFSFLDFFFPNSGSSSGRETRLAHPPEGKVRVFGILAKSGCGRAKKCKIREKWQFFQKKRKKYAKIHSAEHTSG